MPKDYSKWFNLKLKLDFLTHFPPLVKERELWWCHLGENIGTEINGKNSKFSRPAIIYKKLSRYTYLVIPTSTQLKSESWYSHFKYNSVEMIACLNQVRIIDYRRIENHIGSLSNLDFTQIKQDFIKLYQ